MVVLEFNMKIFIIIPAYNEEKNIKKVVNGIKEKFPDFEIVVVDDSSNDNTYQEVKKTGVIVLKHIVNRDQGAALQTGTEYALKKGAEIIIHFDADGQHRVEDIEDMIKPILNKEADITLGSRFLRKKTKVPFSKKFFILKPAIFLNWFFSGIKLSDAHNGFRALNKKAAEKIVISQDGKAHATEILQEIKKNNLKYKEVPVKIIYNKYGQGFFDGLKILKDLFFRKIF